MNGLKTDRVIRKILILNRSEVALRIQATCKALGIKTVAIYTKEDASCAYVNQADEAYALSKSGFAAFLEQAEIITIALQSDVDAIHPGYGFLAENASFAEKVEEAGLRWIGPSPRSMRQLGDKSNAKTLAISMGVPVAPGAIFKALSMEMASARSFASRAGYPVILKDSMGGGGKAMRRVYSELEFDQAWHAVLSEGKRLGFGGTIIVEKYVSNARHVEIQIAGDGCNVIHLFERDCSVQRKHQKIVEEAPCSFVSQATREKIYTAAVEVARAVSYRSIGTVEFLVGEDEQFYFLEVNARLQVEHSVTEMVTGVDLVALQICIAQTGTLPFKQEYVSLRGSAIQCRIYAEDPFNNYVPSVGTITHLLFARQPYARIDHDLYEGYEVSPFFDPMIGKVSVFGSTREQAIGNMLALLNNSFIIGLQTNLTFLKAVLACKTFMQGGIHTQFLASPENMAELISTRDAQLAQAAPEESLLAPLIAAIAKAELMMQLNRRELAIKKNPPTSSIRPWKVRAWK